MAAESLEEEEVILLVELTGLPLSSDLVSACKNNCTILGLESAEPVLQFDKYFFKGSYEDILGTAMVFEQGKGKKLNYLCKASKKLVMSRVVLKNKEQSNASKQTAATSPQGTIDLQTPPTDPLHHVECR